jgi:hypothetical protein
MKKRFLFSIFFIIFLILFSLYLWLFFKGIKIDSFSYKNYTINKLSLKIDKKLVLEVNNINILPINNLNNSSNEIEKIKKYISKIPILLYLFEKIQIKNIFLNKDNISFKYIQNKLYLNSKDIKLEATPYFSINLVKLNIKSLNIKKYNININGQIILDYFQNNILYIGNLNYKKQVLNLDIKSNMNYIDFFIRSEDLTNIKVIKDFYRFNSSTEKWLYKNIQGTHNINFLTFKYDINKNKVIDNSIDLDINIKNTNIKFRDNLPSLITNNLNARYKDGDLKIIFDKLKYKEVLFNNSSIKINNLNNNNDISLFINLELNSIINNNIQEILKSYSINLPLKQIGGKLYSNISMKLNIANNKLDINSNFVLKNTVLDLNGLKLDIKKADILLKNNIIVIRGYNISTFEKKLFLKDLILNLNIENSKANGKIDIKYFNLGEESKDIIDIKDIESKIDISFSKNIKVNLDNLGIKVINKKNNTFVEIKNLSKYIKYSNILKNIGTKDGNLNLNFMQDGKIILNSNIKTKNSPLNFEDIKLSGIINKDNIRFTTSDNRLKIITNKFKTKIFINNLNIMANNFSIDYKKKKAKSKSNLYVEAKNSNIILSDKTKILSDNFELIKVGDNLKFVLNYKKTKVNFNLINKIYVINIKNANDKFLNTFLGKKDLLEGGKIDISGISKVKNKKIIQGVISIENMKLKNLTVLNNAMALIQSSYILANPYLALPSLFRVVKGDMTFDGYKILKGNIKYTYDYTKEEMDLYKIKTKGAEIDFDAMAKFDLKNSTINSKIRMIFMKDISYLVSKIPLANKVLLDNKKNISTIIKITGDTQSPASEFVIFNE